MKHAVSVGPLPGWMDVGRLLGPGAWTVEDGSARAVLETDAAADVAARLRGLGFGGAALDVQIAPPLKRAAVRAGRTREARARRDTTPGFLRAGTRTDDEGRWSLTPEALARFVARGTEGREVVDLGCGVGGNAIAFALAGARVRAVERDGARLAMARHNARLYGVEDRIRFELADAMNLLPTLSGDLLWVDPPWGVDWDRIRTTADDMPLLQAALAAEFRSVWAKVPPSFDPGAAPLDVTAVFGAADGDRHRVKFLWLRREH